LVDALSTTEGQAAAPPKPSSVAIVEPLAVVGYLDYSGRDGVAADAVPFVGVFWHRRPLEQVDEASENRQRLLWPGWVL